MPEMNVYARLAAAREEFHALALKKSGYNKFAGYRYFELGDFVVSATALFRKHGLCAVVSFAPDVAMMDIINIVVPEDRIRITSPFGSAELKGCHSVQNIGAVETYQRRYLWAAAIELVEHDAIEESATPEKKKRLPKLTDEEAAYERQKWIEIKSLCVDDKGNLDHEMVVNEWGKLPANIRSAIKRYDDNVSKENGNG